MSLSINVPIDDAPDITVDAWTDRLDEVWVQISVPLSPYDDDDAGPTRQLTPTETRDLAQALTVAANWAAPPPDTAVSAEQVQAFKDAWAWADSQGFEGRRVEFALTAVMGVAR